MTIRDTLQGRNGRYSNGTIRGPCNSELRRDAGGFAEAAFEVRTEAVADTDLPKRETATAASLSLGEETYADRKPRRSKPRADKHS